MPSSLPTKRPRIEVADVLRGFAVMGIIILHTIEHYNFYSYPDTSGQCALLNFTDKAIWDGLFFTFGGKAYAIFALLFGFSFFIQDDNQRLCGKDFRLRFCWRLVLLFLLGNINAAFFTAEVLVLYSIVGFVLVLTCRLSDRAVFILATICLLQPLHWIYLFMALANPAFTLPNIPTKELWEATFAAQNQTSFIEMVRVNLTEGQLASLAWAWDNARFFQTAALFMFGMLVGRRGLLAEAKAGFWCKVLGWSLAAFFPLYGLDGMLPDFIASEAARASLALIVSSLHKCAFMFVLVSAVILLYYRSGFKGILARLAPYGRMSLTNYISQSIIGAAIFYHWGLGLQAGVTASAAIGIAIFLLQFAFCKWWMGRYAHGPMEYIWKRATWLR
ncbi:DUF418 domain-containing protein [Bacteroides thetaiotaomicron]|uniref:DUF418 domain-containing protein n=1 Tax=Bacteroides thetaiotaomicron TaxID=818 RepID=UPI0032608540